MLEGSSSFCASSAPTQEVDALYRKEMLPWLCSAMAADFNGAYVHAYRLKEMEDSGSPHVTDFGGLLLSSVPTINAEIYNPLLDQANFDVAY
ncbi:hypothetical protein ACLOJK_029375 [Asimina triloba]